MKSMLIASVMAVVASGVAAPHAVAQTTKPVAAPTPALTSKSVAVDADTRIVETTNYNAWVLICEGRKAGAPDWRCQANFTMKDHKSGAVLLVWFLSVNKDGKISAEIVTMTGVQVDKGVDLAIGAQPKRRKVAYSWCDANQCSAQAVLDDASLKDLVAAVGDEVTLTTTLKDGRALKFNFPLAGVDKVVARLKG